MPVPAGSGSAVPLADVKRHLDMTTTENDAELQAFIDAAEARLTYEVGPLTAASVTEKHDGGRDRLLLHTYPIVTVDAVTINGAALDVTTLDVDGASGIVYGTFNGGRRGVIVSYTAGRTTLPADLRQAVLELVAHLWESQRGSAPAAGGFGDTDPPPTGTFPGLPYAVQKLIEPHRRAATVA